MADTDVTVTHGTDGHGRQSGEQAIPGQRVRHPYKSEEARAKAVEATRKPRKRAKSPSGRIAEFERLIALERSKTAADDGTRLATLALCDEHVSAMRIILERIANGDQSGKMLDRLGAVSAKIQRALKALAPKPKKNRASKRAPQTHCVTMPNGEPHYLHLPSHIAHPEQVWYEDDHCKVLGPGDPSKAIDAELV